MRGLVPAALLALALLAGCTGTHSPTGTTATAPTPQAAFTLRHGLISDSQGFGEPSMGVSSHGVLFTDLGSNVYVSRDDGANWTNTGNHQQVPNEDPDLAMGADDSVWESRDYIGCVGVAVSRDLAATWTANPLVCPGTALDRQYVIPTHEGTALMYAHQVGSQYQLAAKTTDYGQTWLPLPPPEGVGHQTFVNGGSGWGGGGFWDPVHDAVYFTFTFDEGQPASLLTSKSHAAFTVTKDGGQTWRLGYAGDLEGSALGLGLVTGAVDDAGNAYVTWGEASGSNNKDVALYAAASRDGGQTWTPKVRVDATPYGKVFPIAVAGQPGKVAVAYYEGDKAAYPDQMDGTWNVTLAWTDDFFAPNVTFYHGTLDTAVKKTPICISGTTCTGNREFDDYFDAVRMPDGRVAATYNVLQGTGQGAKLRNGFAITAEPLLGPKA